MSKAEISLKVMFIFIAMLFTPLILSANPFLDEQALNQGRNNERAGNSPTMREPMPTVPLPLPLHSPSPVSHSLVPDREREQTQWIIKGKINNKVVITNGKRERLIDNGSSIDDCIVHYPEILCGDKKRKEN